MFQTLPSVVLFSILVFTAGTREAPASRQSKSALRSLSDYLEENENLLTPTRNVFGFDDRIPMESTKYPWRAIGKLSTGCTGTLVGPSLVLTAAHCVIDKSTHSVYKNAIYFYADMINGAKNTEARVTYVWYGTNTPGKKRERDWALLRLDKRLGDTQGWFSTQVLSLATMKITNGVLVGYSSDFRNGQTAGVHMNCKIMEEYRINMFLHDCDSTRGSSGGPIFAYRNNQPTIYALNVADLRNGGDNSLRLPQFTDKNGNIAIWSSELQNKILQLNAS